jgi:hypothetical protein
MGWFSFIAKAFETSTPTLLRCRACRHFRNDPAYIEATFKGLTSFSSGYGSARADDGLCTLHDLYLSADSTCPQFKARVSSTAGELSIR